MNSVTQKHFLDKTIHFSAGRLTYLWLLIGLLLLPFTFFQTVIPMAGWLAPVFLLRFSRTSKSRSLGTLGLIFLVYIAALSIASRGNSFNLQGEFGLLFKAFLWTLPYAIDRLLMKRLAGWTRSLVFPCAFISIDWGLAMLRVSSFGSPAYSQDGYLLLLQILSITGMWGITFLIMWCAAIVNGWWENCFHFRPVRGMAITFGVILGAALLYGGIRLARPEPASKNLQTALITVDNSLVAKIYPTIDWAKIGQSSNAVRAALQPTLSPTVEQMLARSESALRSGAKIVAWQESSGWVLEENKPNLIGQVAGLAKQYGAYLQISLEVITHASTMQVLRNQSILIDPSGQVLWTYDKIHPDPYIEAWATIAGSGKLPMVDTPYGLWSTAICYDNYYPALDRQAGQRGVVLLFAPTNDIPSFAESAFSIAADRAIENGFTMLRPTGQGFSAVIDDRGRVLFKQNYFNNPDGIDLVSLPLRSTQTIYSQIGDGMAYLSMAGLFALTSWAILRRRR